MKIFRFKHIFYDIYYLLFDKKAIPNKLHEILKPAYTNNEINSVKNPETYTYFQLSLGCNTS